MISAIVPAAVAVLVREDGCVLLGQRPEGKPWAGWWEFPGGKIETGESALEALQRELQEELGTQAIEVYPWLTRSFDYPEKTVKLHFFIVRRWQGDPHGREGQQLAWQNPRQLTVEPMLPANEPVLGALSLAPIYAITNLLEMGEQAFFTRLKIALDAGLKLVQVREKQLPDNELRIFANKVITLAHPYEAKVFLNGDIEMAGELGADGVHLSSAQLMALREKPKDLLCAASCHNSQELMHAQNLALDFVVLSPVLPTKSHMEVVHMGWGKFSELIKGCSIPVYALGGLELADMTTAWHSGAHGIAMQRAVWNQ